MLVSPAVQRIIAGFLNQAKVIASGDLDFVKLKDKFGELSSALIAALVAELDGDPKTTGADKKQLILDAVGALFDVLAVGIIAVPWWLKPFWPLLVSSFRDFALKQAGGVIEWALGLFRSGGLKVA